MDNLDDLFGDADADGINAAIAASLDTDALFQRIERSHLVGCCQRVAWSKAGCIALISADSRKIVVRALFRDKKTAKWSLSDDAPEANASEDVVFTHIEWSSTGLELVAADQFGRLSLFSLGLALNRLERRPVNLTSTVDNLNQIVGLHWLPVNLSNQSRTALIFPALKEGGRWVGNMKLHEILGISNPLENKAAFMCITRRNVIKIVYQTPGQPWSEHSLSLGDLTDSGDMLTHAAFCQANQHLVLVTYDASQRMRLYKIGIQWNLHQGDANHHHSINPQLNYLHVELLDRCVPQSLERTASAQLSSLHLEPHSPTIDHSTFSVIAIFTSAAQDQSGKFSVICRWDLQQAETTLHDSFKNLKSTAPQPAASKPLSRLIRSEDIIVQKAILAIQSNVYHNMFALAASDGTVEFRARDTMQVIMADGSTTKVTSLPQNGFSYLASDCVDISLSPSLATSVITKPDGSVQLHNAVYLPGWAGANADNDLAQTAIVSLARELSIVTCYQLGPDDLLSMIPTDLDRSLRRKFISEVFRTVARNVDYSLEDPKIQSGRVLKDSLLYRIMSAQLITSYDANPLHRDIPAKMAWVLLNLRSVPTNIAQTLTMTQQVRGMSNMEPDLFISLKGLVRWSLDLMTLVFDDLLAIQQFCKGNAEREKILSFVREKNTASLHLLLSSATRSILGMLGSILRNFGPRCLRALEKARNSSQKEGLLQLEAMTNSQLPFSIKSFEQLVAEIDGSVRATYAAAQSTPQQRNAYEQSMLVEDDIPEALSPVLQKLFKEVLPRIESQIDGVGIFATDTTWLGLDEEANRRTRSHPYDVLRKCRITPGAKIRQCRRCGSIVEDIKDAHAPAWVHNGHKMCVCLTQWIIP